MKATKLLWIAAAALTLGSQASASGVKGDYMIPEGNFLEQDLFIRTPNINLKSFPDGTYRLTYKLPKEIDGAVPQQIRFFSISEDRPLDLVGPKGQATCKFILKAMSCNISYTKNQNHIFPINHKAGEEFVQSIGLSHAMQATLVKARMSLMHEANGILQFRLRKRNR